MLNCLLYYTKLLLNYHFKILKNIYLLDLKVARPVSNHSSSSSQRGGVVRKSISPAITDQKQTPLYSNLDEGRILPLHQYILEQAKLSGIL